MRFMRTFDFLFDNFFIEGLILNATVKELVSVRGEAVISTHLRHLQEDTNAIVRII